MKQITNEVADDSDGLEEETTNPGGIKQRVFTVVATQDSVEEAQCHQPHTAYWSRMKTNMQVLHGKLESDEGLFQAFLQLWMTCIRMMMRE